MFSNVDGAGIFANMKEWAEKGYTKRTELGFLPGTYEMVNEGPVME